MADVAQILGVGGPKQTASNGPPPPVPSHHQPSRAMQMQGMSRQVVGVLAGKQDPASADLPPGVPAFPINTKAGDKTAGQEGLIKVGNKWISKSKPARKWTWAPFASSSRTDGALFHHWVRANVEYPDYPFARFDIHLDPVTYSDDEYNRFLKSDAWTRSETDHLMDLSRRFELRWPVVHDRWLALFQEPSDGDARKIEDLQHRYYEVAAILTQNRISQEAAAEAKALAVSQPDPSEDPKAAADQLLIETAAARALASSDPKHQPLMHNLGSGTSNKVFDLNYERERRTHMEALWNRTKEDEAEEAELRKELKFVEAQLRKVKKAGGHILAAAAGGGNKLSNDASSRNPSRSVTPVPSAVAGAAINSAALNDAFASTAPTPMPQTPYLQSGRLTLPATGGGVGLNKTLVSRMQAILVDMKVPVQPIATKRVCDMYDSVRKDALTLLILQKSALQKEGLVESKRLKLAKMGGNVRVVQEETLMGITPLPSSVPSVTNRSKSSKNSKTSKPKGTAGSAGAGKKPGTLKKPTGESKPDTKQTPPGGKQVLAGGIPTKKTAPKRKRKAEVKTPPPSGTTATTTSSGVSAPKGSATKPAVDPSIGEAKTSAKKRPKKSA
ncbi:predicted protein [Phaeodactylum tricornutum CCAP 1055/1]|uniref:dAMP1 SANT/Myb-like domain-containing protein n=1 Tax=Phaeodactylum tricornutum (strain CCAP 1055/1) TaxID=556484 RepID=B7FY22_PHATC|nr:predicted protein [Phaeodactylum tricornutum CCAP 1055/1]EEC48846.1 predicted protein [Phaeodactylum tricornutum CCAP 1055/1]|eukprot:XP_002179860.1 predicted protein [Phaeodactylum tricornutum CCAP 1055/1]